jgi:hypothetical protein
VEGFDWRGLTFEVGKGFWESRPLPHRRMSILAAARLAHATSPITVEPQIPGSFPDIDDNATEERS